MQDVHKPSVAQSAGAPASPPEREDRSQHSPAAAFPSADDSRSLPGSSTSPSPGDDAPAGTVGTGEDVCTRCEGTGKREDGGDCLDCEGTGIIIQGIGGG